MNKGLIIGIIAIVVVILRAVGYFYLYTDENPFVPVEYWEIELVEGWNDEVEFTQEQINACASDNPVDVLSSIDAHWDFIFDDEGQNYWYNQANPSQNGGTLQHILPLENYRIHIMDGHGSQTLRIAKP